MGLRTETAGIRPLAGTIRTYGHITVDETRTAEISPKVSGWIETLHVDFTGSQVQKGDPLLEIYSPELVAAQEEYQEQATAEIRRQAEILDERIHHRIDDVHGLHRAAGLVGHLGADVDPQEARQLRPGGVLALRIRGALGILEQRFEF